MAGMFGSQYNDTKVMIDDLSNLSQMNTAAKADSEGVMKPPKGEEMDAGSWWAWLSGYTRQKTQENVARVQEELASMGVDTTGLSPEYQQSMLEGIQQAQAYRDKWGITTALGDAPTMLEEQGVFPQTSVEQPVGVTEEGLDANEMPEKPSLMDRAIDMFRPSEPEPDSVDTSKPKTSGGLMEKPEPQEFKIPEYKVYNNPDEMSELEILARTIEAEARGEAYEGKIAVGATIANRAASGSYGKDIRGVILRRGQFSPWNSWTGYAKGEQGKDMMKLKASEDSYKAANAILTGNYEDPTDGATHYVNEKVSKPAWLGAMKGRKRGTVTIGNHLFGNADSNKKYDGKSYIYGRSSETMDQPVEAEPPTVKAIQRIIGTKADGDFGPNSRKKAKEYLKDKGVTVPKDADDKTLMSLVVGG